MAKLDTEAAVSPPRGMQEDMEQILARAALKGAQAVAKVCLGLIALVIVIQRSVVFLSGESLPVDPGRAAASSLYLLYSVWMLWRLRRAHADPRRVLPRKGLGWTSS